MPLWGNTDVLASKPKYLTKRNAFNASSTSVISAANDTISIPGHGFQTGDAVLYTTAGTAIVATPVMTTGTTYFVIRVDSDTIKLATSAVNATAGTAINITGVGNQTADTLQLTAPTLFFVDQQEAATTLNKAKGVNGPGWWLYRTYTDAQSNTRHKAECLVAISTPASVSGDFEDTVTVDLAITISEQPANITRTAPATATFTVTATVNSLETLTYQWEKQEAGTGPWAQIVGATSASYTTGPTTVLADNTDRYRVVVTCAGLSVTSNSAILTVN